MAALPPLAPQHFMGVEVEVAVMSQSQGLQH